MKTNLMTFCVLCSLLFGGVAKSGHTSSGKTSITNRDQLRKIVAPPVATVTSIPLKSRTILVLLDTSSPYADYQTALSQLIAATKNLGPGDRLQVMLIAGQFKPQTNRFLTAQMPAAAGTLFIPTKNITQWRRNQAELDAKWRETERLAKDTALNLQRLNGQNRSQVTNLWGALRYGALWLRGEPGDEKNLIVASDLEQDFERQKTTDPPPTLLDFKGVRARLLWVTYNDKRWSRMESHWRQYFQQCEVAELKMFDSGRSTPTTAIEPSSIPRRVPDWRVK